MDTIGKDMLLPILTALHPDESFFVRLVCKQWRDAIKPQKAFLPRLLEQYAACETTDAVELLRSIINDDESFFSDSFFSHASKPVLDWSLPFIQTPDLAPDCIPLLAAAAAKHGYKDLLELMVYQDLSSLWDEDATAAAAFAGHLDLLKWLRANDCPWDASVCSQAAFSNHLDILQYARNNGCDWDEKTAINATEQGHLELLQWAYFKKCPWQKNLCEKAAAHGHLETLKWLEDRGCYLDTAITTAAAANGHLEVLKWARENGIPWDESVCREAAYGGHLEVLKWARANGCKWSKITCYEAANGGKLEVLKWLRENGCPWSEDLWTIARYEHVIEWLQSLQ